MAHKEFNFVELFESFIQDSYSSKRLKKDGKKIKPQTIKNYESVLYLLKEFEKFKSITIRIKQISGRNKREFISERRYWKRFYMRFTDYLFKQRKCYDNYVGLVMKTIRIFFVI